MKKLINFSSIETYDSELLQNLLYCLFFDWDKDLKKGERGKKIFKDLKKDDPESAGNKGKVDEDDEEDKKKRRQVRLDQELLEFEERGGFTKVLRDIFNPTD